MKEPCNHCVLSKKSCVYSTEPVKALALPKGYNAPTSPVAGHDTTTPVSDAASSPDLNAFRQSESRALSTPLEPLEFDSSEVKSSLTYSSILALKKEVEFNKLNHRVHILEQILSVRVPDFATGRLWEPDILSSGRHVKHREPQHATGFSSTSLSFSLKLPCPTQSIMFKYRTLLRYLRSVRRCYRVTARGMTMVGPQAPNTLPSDDLVEEQSMPDYRPQFFFPAKPGEVLNIRYKLLSKIGWGSASTLWLAEDAEREPFEHVTIKITTSNPDYSDMIAHECDINDRLYKDTSIEGFGFIRPAIAAFMANSPNGSDNLCLVFEPMREPLSQLQRRLPSQKIPSQLLKVYMDFILMGIDYLHSQCNIIHTDIKADNIMLTFEDPSVITDYVKAQVDHPMPRKTNGDWTIYLSHNDFGHLKSYSMLPKIIDFGLACRGDGIEPLRHPIQPDLYHAPEVLLGVPWSYSADIWNLGVLLFELLEDQRLFVRQKSADGVYSPEAHLAEMIALLGPPPRKLIAQERCWSQIPWNRSFTGPDGKWCNTARAYYGGPFFNLDSSFRHPEAIPTAVNLEERITSIAGTEKAAFLNFITKLLQWLPEDRKTAKELRDDPWIQSGL